MTSRPRGRVGTIALVGVVCAAESDVVKTADNPTVRPHSDLDARW